MCNRLNIAATPILQFLQLKKTKKAKNILNKKVHTANIVVSTL